MTVTVTTPADLAVTNGNVVALTTRVAANENAIKDILRRLGLDETAIAALTPPVVVPPIIVPPYDPLIQWHAGMESGDLSEWPGLADNTGSANSTAVQAAAEGIPARTPWVMKQAITGAAGGATRMTRWQEIGALSKAGTPFFLSWWDYYPSKITFGPSDMFSMFQICSQDANGVYSPIWGLFLNGGDGGLTLGWSPNRMAPAEGPHAGEAGGKAYVSTVPVPIAKWTFFEVYIKPAADFTGAVKLWMDRVVIFDQSLVKTRFPDTAPVGGYQYIQFTAYGSGVTPIPAVHFIDDCSISLGRMP